MADGDCTQKRCLDCKEPAHPGLSRCQKHHVLSKERAQAWKDRNPEKVKAHRRLRYEKNKEEIKARSRAWAAANRERKAAASAAWAKANPDRVLHSRMKRFGISANEYMSMLSAQGHVCAICGTPDPGGRGRFAVDHDHKAEADGFMRVRGLLCMSCNRGLGYFADNAEALRNAAIYLESATAGPLPSVGAWVKNDQSTYS